MTKDILIHQSYDGTWSAQREGEFFRPDGDTSYPYYFETLDVLLNCINDTIGEEL